MKIQLKKLLVIGYVWPEPNSSAAGSRMMQLLNAFLQQGYQITFASPAKQGDHKEDLSQLGIDECAIELNSQSFNNFIEKLNPQVVIFDRFMMEEQFGWRVAESAPNAIKILNTEDFHSLREARQQIVKNALKQDKSLIDLSPLQLQDKETLFTQLSAMDMAKREVASLFRCDLNLMISNYEIELLQAKFQIPRANLFHLPFIYKANNKYQDLPTFSERQHFVTIGNFRHAPNWDAVLWLKQTIWPLIRKQLPKAELHIYGAYPPPKATALNNPQQGFLVKGWAEDAHQVISNAKVMLAPLRFGAGIKGKLAEAMLNGTPSITTSIGAEDMIQEETSYWPGNVSDNIDDFVKAAIELYSDSESWENKSIIGFNLFSQQFVLNNKNTYTDNLFQILDPLRKNLDTHRQHNFIGAMLNHHHHKSTQYMSQWIEEKNRRKNKH